MPATAQPWRRYGHDRVYVTADDGTRLGFLDLKTGEVHEVPPGREDEFHAAVRPWVQEAPADSPPTPQRQHKDEDSPGQDSLAQPWTDLAANQPGQSPAEVAAAYRQAQPVQSLIDRLFSRRNPERAWRVGAKGEVETARRLRGLTNPGSFGLRTAATWHILHSVPLGDRGRDIDHLLIGTPGVFAINSKRHEGLVTATRTAIMVGSHRTRYAEVAQDEAHRAQHLLTAAASRPVPVIPVISVVAAPVVTRGQPRGVTVLPAKRLAEWLLALPEHFSGDEVQQIFEVARRSTTWQQ
ncbi:nuclease-related domain-containing protein [Actinoplanes awajinensis]|uniref:nuclease-related domain-containing protein n=1 Tax=Actinoplanes awajinensis TaxID=135946 RepID=UPI000A047E16